jgi:hypothetical protein
MRWGRRLSLFSSSCCCPVQMPQRFSKNDMTYLDLPCNRGRFPNLLVFDHPWRQMVLVILAFRLQSVAAAAAAAGNYDEIYSVCEK